MEEEVIEIEFTNGALKQLKELTEFYKTESYLETIKLGIAMLQKIYEKRYTDELGRRVGVRAN